MASSKSLKSFGAMETLGQSPLDAEFLVQVRHGLKLQQFQHIHRRRSFFTALLDDDITDDVKCVQKIHKEWLGLQGNGFVAWQVGKYSLKMGRIQNVPSSSFYQGCVEDEMSRA